MKMKEIRPSTLPVVHLARDITVSIVVDDDLGRIANESVNGRAPLS
jgi:hypothetical protein